MSTCCGETPKCLVYACSGGSDVGQLTNEAAKSLDSSNEATMACLAGLGGHISGMIASAESGVPVLLLDGCPVACARKTFDHLGLKGYGYVVVTSLGIKKQHAIKTPPFHQVEEVVKAARQELTKVPVKSSEAGCSCRG